MKLKRTFPKIIILKEVFKQKQDQNRQMDGKDFQKLLLNFMKLMET
jgi:hypothetical protein